MSMKSREVQAEDARVWVWYLEIKNICGWTDYRLNYEFSWTSKGLTARSSTKRSRVFDWIRKEARKPQGRDARWYKMDDLVAVVDQHPLFYGTQAMYSSMFWDILQQQAFTLDAVQLRLDQLLKKNGLIRVNPKHSVEITKLITKYGREQVYDRCLLMSLKEMDNLSGMALTWLLYLQTEPAQNRSIRAVVESIAERQLEKFFYHYFPLSEHHFYYTNSINALLGIRLNISERKLGYGNLETVGVWPIIPQRLAHSISAEHLFSNLF